MKRVNKMAKTTIAELQKIIEVNKVTISAQSEQIKLIVEEYTSIVEEYTNIIEKLQKEISQISADRTHALKLLRGLISEIYGED
jgi:DNA-binding ferritin-like protein